MIKGFREFIEPNIKLIGGGGVLLSERLKTLPFFEKSGTCSNDRYHRIEKARSLLAQQEREYLNIEPRPS